MQRVPGPSERVTKLSRVSWNRWCYHATVVRIVGSLLVVALFARHAHAGDDPAVAFALSGGGTAASFVAVGVGIDTKNPHLGIGGLVSLSVTPSLGHLYAGDPLSAGLVVRSAGLGAMAGGWLWMVHSCPKIADTIPCVSGGFFLTLAGMIATVVGTGLDVGTAADAARDARPAAHMFTLGGSF